MAFNPKTGLVYIPAQEIPMIYDLGEGFQAGADRLEHRRRHHQFKADVKGYLIAWDPGEPEGGVARQLSRALERRHTDHRRQSCDSGKRRRLLQRLSRRYRRETVVDVQPSPR